MVGGGHRPRARVPLLHGRAGGGDRRRLDAHRSRAFPARGLRHRGRARQLPAHALGGDPGGGDAVRRRCRPPSRVPGGRARVSLVVVIGGTRSGKSARAEALAAASGLSVTYVATGAVIDGEMRERVARHRARRPARWATVEPDADPLAVAATIARDGGCALVDGIGGWLATAQHHGTDLAACVAAARELSTRGGRVIVVAEHAGAGVTPMDALTRAWVDAVGEVTQALVARAEVAELVVAGRVVPLAAGAPAGGDRPLVGTSEGDEVRPVAPTSGAGGGPPDDALADLRVHGDAALAPGLADHAVNVLDGGPPGWLRAALRTALETAVDRYPDERDACAALAARHGRTPGEVVPTNGAAEALWLLGPALAPRHAAVVHPAFTETEAGLRAHGIPVTRVLRDPDAGFALHPSAVPADADLVVVGNPASPSGTLDPAAALLALRAPGRTVVVDEAFLDLVPGEPGSLAAEPLPDVIVVRSLTKSLALAGVRAGYALAAPALAQRLRDVRPPWSVNALALAALRAAAERPDALADAARRAEAEREDLVARLADAVPGLRTWPSVTNFVLVEMPDGPGAVARLRADGIAVRHAASFPGLHAGHVRLTARDPQANARLVAALAAAVPAGVR
ncbi:hypothetical protein C7Y72_06985 [Paraconexibacter algicola]|uniref:Aminotransferase class I/classII large domain-containing protein n=1 Tax=Paraconexibacter algicola TaxID=2133960 RepID=A0A2T4UJJ4_9ACTN|nr:hypothetical protein C7Y72_06985 [Paraconexibacter algicola]